MNPKNKTISSGRSPRHLLFSVVRAVCIGGMSYYMGKAVLSGVHTIGAIIYRLFPVLTFSGVLLLLETQQRNFEHLFSLPSLSDIKVSIKYFPILFICVIGSVLFVLYSSIGSPVDMAMILLVFAAACVSVILMFKGRSVDALCVFILVWPFIIFENGNGRFFFYMTNHFNDILGIDTSDAAMLMYSSLLLTCWLLRFWMNRRQLVPEISSSGIWFFLVAGLFSTLASLQPISSLPQFIRAIFLPVLFFVFLSTKYAL